MPLTIVINTCCESLNKAIVNKRSCYGSGPKTYGERATKLAEVLRRYTGWVDTIVVGEYHPPLVDEYYTYIHYPGPTSSPEDSIWQRDAGAREAELRQSEVIVFLNDDHYLPMQFFWQVVNLLTPKDQTLCYDVVAFSRRMIVDGVEKVIPDDGMTDPRQYIMGHAIAMGWDAVTKVPWCTVPQGQWDVKHSEMLKKAGLRIYYSPDLFVYDIERGDLPDE